MNVLVNTNSGFQPFGYAGGLYDIHTGLVRFGARDYDSYTGRWTAKDPIILRDFINLYIYSSNNPINYIDSNGLWKYRPIGGGHNSITSEAIKATNLSRSDYNSIMQSHRELDMPGFLGGKWSGLEEYHYNKIGSENLSQQMIQIYLEKAIQLEKWGYHEEAMRYLGYGTHLLQDYFSHSLPRSNNCLNNDGKLPHADDPSYYKNEYNMAINATKVYLNAFELATQ